MSKEKTHNIELAIAKINKAFGDRSIQRLGDSYRSNVDVISTGSLDLDLKLGIGGLPRGRIVEIYGPESSFKTSVCLHVIAQAQKNGGVAAFIDAEHALDVEYAQKIGVKIEDILLAQPSTGEAALDIVETLCESKSIDVIVVDSVAALVPKREVDGEMGDSNVGVHAKLMSQGMRKLTAPVYNSNTLVIFINQLRSKVGVFYGSPEVTTGGNALKYYASVRIDMRRGEPIKSGEDTIGSRVKAKIIKNKLAPPHKIAEFPVLYGFGVDTSREIVEVASYLGLIEKKGAWYTYGDFRGHGEAAMIGFFRDNPDESDRLAERIKSIVYSGGEVSDG